MDFCLNCPTNQWTTRPSRSKRIAACSSRWKCNVPAVEGSRRRYSCAGRVALSVAASDPQRQTERLLGIGTFFRGVFGSCALFALVCGLVVFQFLLFSLCFHSPLGRRGHLFLQLSCDSHS